MWSCWGKGEIGELKVGCGPSVADGFMGVALAALLRERPQLTVHVRVVAFPELIPLLQTRQIDLLVGDYSLLETTAGLEIYPLPRRRSFSFVGAGIPWRRRRP